MTAHEIAAALELFVAPDQYTEFRALDVGGPGRIFGGWFDGRHLLDLARAALGVHRQATRCQFMPNPVRPDAAERRLNKVLDVHRGFKLTTDADLEDRRWLIVDVDPWGFWRDKPDPDAPREKQPSSWRELAMASRVARKLVRPFLADRGFPDPVEMLTGNGIHLVYPIEPTPAGRCAAGDPVARLLQLIGERSNIAGVTVDPSTFNPARMLRVPGTLNRKGKASPGRPYRTARVLTVPHDWTRPEYVPTHAPAAEPAPAPVAPPPPAVGARRGERARPDRPDRSKPTPARVADALVASLFDAGPRGRPASGH
jgi:hypothetical protein